MDENKFSDAEFVFDEQLDALGGQILSDAQLEAIADGIVSHSCVDVDKYLQCVRDSGDVYACTLKNFVKDTSRCDNPENADLEVEHHVRRD